MKKKLIVAFSGGKDSTAMALRLHELGVPFDLLHTPTGNELPGVKEHVKRVARATGARVIMPAAPSLSRLIREQGCLPNWRMRFCTRTIKIEPCARWLLSRPNTVLAVGLRADEEGRAGGTYEGSKIIYPLQDWGWNEQDVRAYVKMKGFQPPDRTDCAWCYAQTLYEWWLLWKRYPKLYREGEELEAKYGHTFRSPQRDTWPASLRELRKRFERGDVPKQRERKVACRVCSM
jgi:PP-loop superfamily ATP-utilizing enzyme